mmetsp:Transcript_4777/g.13732  ORF Transcript_4777/g.13732 Transcript_4777/m.13732 type:complete len:112 (-) Transcript_4777:432-767(-)
MLRIINRISGTSVLQVVRPGLTSAQTSVRSLATKEASGKGLGEAKENDPDVIEKGKKASQKQEDWQETVASESEAVVKADRDHHGHGTDIEKMQKHTVEKVKETHGTPASS